jgi:hypothetical protein
MSKALKILVNNKVIVAFGAMPVEDILADNRQKLYLNNGNTSFNFEV